MTHFNLLVIGFGKAGKTLAKYAASQGQHVALVEQSSDNFGGTCINHGCIPSKVLVHDGIYGTDFDTAFSRKKDVVSALNKKNYDNLANDTNIEVFNYKAQFKSNTEVNLLDEDGAIAKTLTADKIVINTGAKSNIPPIKGIDIAQNLYDSRGLLNISYQPKHLVIIGGGYIALEFASMFANFGSKVTVIEYGAQIMPREDQDVVAHAIKDLEDKGITFITNAKTLEFKNENNQSTIVTSKGNFSADAVLLATGRIPNTDLALENTDIELGERGEIKVNDHLRTSVEHIYAVGDVKGGLQFTYISLDDFRILKSSLYGDQSRTTLNRGTIPYTVFIDPPFSRVGLTAKEAQSQGYNYIENTLLVAQIPRHKINNDARGIFKVVINKDTDLILGATLYGKESEEIINLIKLTIDQYIPYQVLRDTIYTHPTIVESFNDLFNI
ncbi:dihydrolipoamide dehydrogenase [Staphylococcus haemolyticus]|uniref:hypothiocyanous acid reductase MerA n=1 Tax=Staphylococcus haemolyticus TaxID=1283 RepID=UPI0007073664|nr:hypothiocyanous acid reductase MerA [Staphylococcus haemolyticus]KQC16995.1 dihydrolipoamide dehydrogenase [Staphylococcus haemolyticus]PNY85598.1 dihydrolipoamide dehydrogenase [Staphylococcus haemolyticus]QCY39203.1 dihydrolipoamide dehydrogenase [Staphylococcus haemolyticus]QXA66506.1 FAD-dependent oxidoreductase [Staphylococcus haemolyticus]SUM39997.1 putative dehydrogenase, Mercuric ion reductase-like protein [Staphylococcus haemolyticus]